MSERVAVVEVEAGIEYCSACLTPIKETDETCPSCGAWLIREEATDNAVPSV